MTRKPGFRHERTFLNRTAVLSLIESSCLLHVLQKRGIFFLMYSVCYFTVVRLLTVVYFSMCNVCWAAAWGMVGFLWRGKELCPSVETAVEVSQGLWHGTDVGRCGRTGVGSMHSMDRAVLNAFTPGWCGCHLLSCGLPWSCSKAWARCKHSSRRIGIM